MARYFDREGRRIDAAAWAELQKKPDYATVKEFDNGAVRLRLVWIGKISEKEHASFRDCWPLYVMGVWNYTDTGALVPDPVANGETFPNESDALTAYEDFLINWTDSEMGETGVIEVGNSLAPPPPPDPDKPTTEMILDEDNDAAW